MTRRTFLVAIAVLVSVALPSGCGTPGAASHRQTPSPPFPQPSGVTTLTEVPGATTLTEVPPEQPSSECENPRQSLRPRGPLPPPGEMPAGTPMSEIRQRGRLIVGIGTNAHLLAFRDPYTGEVRGFEADLVREIAFAIFGDHDPRRIQFRASNMSGRIQAVQDKTVDMVIAATTMTCERWQKVAFSAEYYSGGQQILVYKNSPFKRIEDLGGKKVCASAGSVDIEAIASIESKPVPLGAANTSGCLLLLQQGQIDAVSTDDLILAGLAAQDPATHITGPRFTDHPAGILMAHDHPDLVRFVNGVLEKLIANGTWARLQETWFAKQIGSAKPPIPQYRKE